MAKFFPQLSTALQNFIADQQMFFVATADVDGRVNLSPKGLDSLKVLGPERIIWLNLTGSGNETAAHLLAVNRMTLMFCSFAGNPLILRVYGTARAVYPGDEEWDTLVASFPRLDGARQIFDLQIESVQTSCGYAVPLYDYVGQRDRLFQWAEQKGEEGIKQYWVDRNAKSIDGKPTGMRAPDSTQ
ncbi:MAG: pyridoxamine 5'-phosphate oxidase family protein [Bacteroidota bacterium]